MWDNSTSASNFTSLVFSIAAPDSMIMLWENVFDKNLLSLKVNIGQSRLYVKEILPVEKVDERADWVLGIETRKAPVPTRKKFSVHPEA
jgi:hypothetical protein